MPQEIDNVGANQIRQWPFQLGSDTRQVGERFEEWVKDFRPHRRAIQNQADKIMVTVYTPKLMKQAAFGVI